MSERDAAVWIAENAEGVAIHAVNQMREGTNLPAPTDDAVERAVARMEISARDHRESAAQCEDQGDMDGYSASTDAADILDRHVREIRAALAAAGARVAGGRATSEQIARAIEARRDQGESSTEVAFGWRIGMSDAARIARGES